MANVGHIVAMAQIYVPEGGDPEYDVDEEIHIPELPFIEADMEPHPGATKESSRSPRRAATRERSRSPRRTWNADGTANLPTADEGDVAVNGLTLAQHNRLVNRRFLPPDHLEFNSDTHSHESWQSQGCPPTNPDQPCQTMCARARRSKLEASSLSKQVFQYSQY